MYSGCISRQTEPEILIENSPGKSSNNQFVDTSNENETENAAR
jgi:hypothetical protein